MYLMGMPTTGIPGADAQIAQIYDAWVNAGFDQATIDILAQNIAVGYGAPGSQQEPIGIAQVQQPDGSWVNVPVFEGQDLPQGTVYTTAARQDFPAPAAAPEGVTYIPTVLDTGEITESEPYPVPATIPNAVTPVGASILPAEIPVDIAPGPGNVNESQYGEIVVGPVPYYNAEGEPYREGQEPSYWQEADGTWREGYLDGTIREIAYPPFPVPSEGGFSWGLLAIGAVGFLALRGLFK